MSRINVAIIGLGLIGGSIAKGLCTLRDVYRVGAFDSDASVLEVACQSGCIEFFAEDLELVVRDADIVVLCVPVCAMLPLVQGMVRFLPRGCVLTDVGSVKGFLQEQLVAVLPEGVCYVGGHPMAGSERSGLAASDGDIFRGRPFVVIPSAGADERAVARVFALAQALSAKPVLMEATEHDRAVALVSHMPHVLSAALMLAAAEDDGALAAKALAAGCFRDMTRVSGADERMWTDICLANAEAIELQMGKVSARLDEALARIRAGDEEWLFEFFARAKAARQGFGLFSAAGKGE